MTAESDDREEMMRQAKQGIELLHQEVITGLTEIRSGVSGLRTDVRDFRAEFNVLADEFDAKLDGLTSGVDGLRSQLAEALRLTQTLVDRTR